MERREKTLHELAELLRAQPHTARGIAKRLGCTKPTAYARVCRLQERGVAVVAIKVREGYHGPLAFAYSIAA